jgi:methionyl aminopeptidase
MIKYKSAREIELMRQAGLIVAGAMKLAREMIKPELSTVELDVKMTDYVVKHGGEMAFKGYRGYPANVCVSINEELVHGIPDSRRIKSGDIVSVDVGVRYKNYYADAAFTVGAGEISEKAKRLIEVTQKALDMAIDKVEPGRHLFEISGTIQNFVESQGYSVVRQYVGHGIGTELHEDPQVPNYRISPEEQADVILKPGVVIAIEPMVNEGSWEVETLKNKWTVVTRDRKLCAHFEHSVVVTDSGYDILTKE